MSGLGMCLRVLGRKFPTPLVATAPPVMPIKMISRSVGDLPRPSVPKSLDQLKSEFSFQMTLPVEFCELDAMAHVNNTTYFKWFESIRVRQFSTEIEPEFSFTPVGIKPVISDTWCRYRRPIMLYDSVVVGVRATNIIPEQGEFKHIYAVWSTKQNTVAAMGGCTIVVCDFDNGGGRTDIPDHWLKMLK